MLEEYREETLDLFSRMIGINAVNPASGGPGEHERAEFLKKAISRMSPDLEFEEFTADYNGIKRPNILITLDAGREKTVWFVAHMDTVTEGDMGLWKYPPFSATIDGDRIYGRGTCDNGQGIISSILTLRYFIDHRDEMGSNLGIILVSDEETGSAYGIGHVLKQRKFVKNDKFIVPDFGTPDGSEVEVAEKGIFWLKVTVVGEQCHGSTPEKGKNAHRLARVLEGRIDQELHRKFNGNDTLFSPPFSTFEPTKVEPGTASINIIPGRESFYFDMRILPAYSTDEVLAEITRMKGEFEREFGVSVILEPVQKEEPSFNSPGSRGFVDSFISSVRRVRGIGVRETGIGGGTCGAFFRREGLDTIVWGTLDDTEHKPNEYAKISNVFGDASVFIDFIKNY